MSWSDRRDFLVELRQRCAEQRRQQQRTITITVDDLDLLVELAQPRVDSGLLVEAREAQRQQARVEIQRAITERWTVLERCRPGTILYVGGVGTIRVGSAVQTGDSLKVVSIDRKRERIRLRLHRVAGKLQRDPHCFDLDPPSAHSYQLSRSKPERAADEHARDVGRKLGKMLGGES